MSRDLPLFVAGIAGTATILAAVITARLGTRKQLTEIHVLANSRLQEALDEIQTLRRQVARLQHQLDGLKKK